MIRPSMTLSQIDTLVADTFSSAIIGRATADELNEMLTERFWNPMNARTPAGRPRFSGYMVGYVAGLVAAHRARIWQEHVEFCYRDSEGVFYSTWKQSTRRSTNEFYDSGRGCELGALPSGFMWRDNRYGDREFTEFKVS